MTTPAFPSSILSAGEWILKHLWLAIGVHTLNICLWLTTMAPLDKIVHVTIVAHPSRKSCSIFHIWSGHLSLVVAGKQRSRFQCEFNRLSIIVRTSEQWRGEDRTLIVTQRWLIEHRGKKQTHNGGDHGNKGLGVVWKWNEYENKLKVGDSNDKLNITVTWKDLYKLT